MATGVSWFTMAFVLDGGDCEPQGDGCRPLTGGVDRQSVDAVRGAVGDIVPSFGAGSGDKLETGCQDASAPAGADQKVIDAYDLKAIDIDIDIDIDIEGDAYNDPAVRRKTIDAPKQGARARTWPCPGAYPNDDTCSGTEREPWEFTTILAGFTG